MLRKKIWLLFPFLWLLLAGCNDQSAALEVLDVWGRAAPAETEAGAFYMQIVNGSSSDEQLLAASTPHCQRIEFHIMQIDENNVMRMYPVPGGMIELPAKTAVSLAPGGMHMMCVGKTAAFATGDELPLTLTFANQGEMTITVTIRDGATAAHNHNETN